MIATLNEEAAIGPCIDAIRASRYPQASIHIVVADTGSTDRTAEIVGHKQVQLVTVSTSRPSAAAGFAAGYAVVQADYVQYLGADVLVDPDWFRQGIAAFERYGDERLAVVAGRLEERNRSLFGTLLRASFGAENQDVTVFPSASGTGLLRNEALRKVGGGFRADMTSEEEPELGIRLALAGYIVIKIPQLMISHDLGLSNTWSSTRLMIRRSYRAGIGVAQLQALHGEVPLGRQYITQWKRRFLRSYVLIGALCLALFGSALLAWPQAFVAWVIGLGLVWGGLLVLAHRKKTSTHAVALMLLWSTLHSAVAFWGFMGGKGAPATASPASTKHS